MKKTYRISKKAAEDLDEIWLYTYKTWSLEQADRYYNLIMHEIKYLATRFESGREISHLRTGYRISKVKSHYIFYKRSGDEIMEVIRILHERMNIEKRLK